MIRAELEEALALYVNAFGENGQFAPLLAAAQLVLDGEPLQWCVRHEAAQIPFEDPPLCWDRMWRGPCQFESRTMIRGVTDKADSPAPLVGKNGRSDDSGTYPHPSEYL